MNQTTTVTLGVIAVALIGGIAYYATTMPSTPSDTASTTPVVVTQPSSPAPVVTRRAPLAVTSPNVTTSEVAASVSGTVTPNGYYTSYWFEYGKTADLGSRIAVQNIGSGYTPITSPGYISGLTKDTTYYFHLVAQNEVSKYTGAIYTFKTNPGNPAPIGGVPSAKTMMVSAVSSNSASVTGEVSPNKAATQYWFEYGKTSAFGSVSNFATVPASSGTTGISSALNNLSPGTTYFYRLNAQNQFGTVNGTVLNFKTTGNPTQGEPITDTTTVSNLRSTSATFGGTVNPDGLETIYWFEYSTDSLLGNVVVSATPHVSAGTGSRDVSIKANVTGLVSNTTYFYRAVGQNSLGTTYGDRVSFKTK
jgi:phosphodiesterase/alkaline phosphatase D-like protein